MKIIMLGAPGAGKGTQAKKIAEKYGIPHISTGDIFRANIKNGTELGKKAKTYMDQGLLVPDELVVDLVVDRVNQEDCAGGYVLDGFPRTIPQAEALDKALSEMGQKVDYAINVEVPDENIVNRMSGRRAMDQGLLVPDELVVDLVVDRVNQEDCAGGYVLDGFPRTIPQAEALDKALSEMGQKVDYAINVEVPDENIVNRMSGRRACVDCGATYHIVYAPTKEEGVCDKCGGSLILRDDDKPETVLKRLGVYHEQTQPLIDYYTQSGILKEVDGTIDINDVFAEIVKILGE